MVQRSASGLYSINLDVAIFHPFIVSSAIVPSHVLSSALTLPECSSLAIQARVSWHPVCWWCVCGSAVLYCIVSICIPSRGSLGQDWPQLQRGTKVTMTWSKRAASPSILERYTRNTVRERPTTVRSLLYFMSVSQLLSF